MIRKASAKACKVLVHLVYERTVLVLSILLCIAIIGILWHQFSLQSRLVESAALQEAARYTQVLAEFRTLYTGLVVEVVRAHGIEVTHDYIGKDGAIPLPATLSMELGTRITKKGAGGQTSLYSPYPFPWRGGSGGLRDDFAREAWNFLQQNPDTPFFRFEIFDGHPSLRYAIADVMRTSCINCHNTHPDTPKKDWKVGDVRGVLEVTFPLDKTFAQRWSGLMQTFILITWLVVMGLTILALVISRLRRIATELDQRVKDRTSDLGMLNNELEAFSYSVSHDLRAPLRHMSGFADLLQKEAGPRLNDKGNRYLQIMKDSAKRMGHLIDDLLNFSRTGRDEVQKSMVSLDHLVQEVMYDFRQETEGRNIVWEIGTLPEVCADRSLLRVALVNLISNAVKFTRNREPAKIEIGYTSGEENGTVLFIRDNGVGFDMKYADKLFGVFQRLHRAEEYEGTGIGLATVQRIIHRHGGRTWAEGSVDGGATFYLSFPKVTRGDRLWKR